MLSDLVQYFTNSSDSILGLYEDTDIVRFLIFVYQKTMDNHIRDGIAADVIGNPYGFYEAFETFGSMVYDGDFHLQDALSHVKHCDNLYLGLILSAFCSEEQAILTYEDSDLSVMLEETEKGYRASSYGGFKVNMKIDRFIDNFVLDVIDDYICDSSDYIDENDAVMTRIVFGYINFRNKSFARKVRKAYKKYPEIKEAFTEMSIFMKNGCFMVLLSYNIESYDCHGEYTINTDVVLEGISKVRQVIGVDNYNQIPRSLSIAFQKMNYNLVHEAESEYPMTFASKVIAVLTRKIKPPEGEIIL